MSQQLVSVAGLGDVVMFQVAIFLVVLQFGYFGYKSYQTTDRKRLALWFYGVLFLGSFLVTYYVQSSTFTSLRAEGETLIVERVFPAPNLELPKSDIEKLWMVLKDHGKGKHKVSGWEIRLRTRAGAYYSSYGDVPKMGAKQVYRNLSEFWGRDIDLYLLEQVRGNTRKLPASHRHLVE